MYDKSFLIWTLYLNLYIKERLTKHFQTYNRHWKNYMIDWYNLDSTKTMWYIHTDLNLPLSKEHPIVKEMWADNQVCSFDKSNSK